MDCGGCDAGWNNGEARFTGGFAVVFVVHSRQGIEGGARRRFVFAVLLGAKYTFDNGSFDVHRG
jgi:hypothetical protein